MRSLLLALLVTSASQAAAPPAVDTRLPAGLAAWPVKKQIAYLIDALKDVDEEQQCCHDSTYLKRDLRVLALVKLGDAAIPALIDAVEKDNRETRAFWHRGTGKVMARDVALLALLTGLRAEWTIRVDGSLSLADAERPATVARLRAYWQKFGHLPIEQRLMAHLADRENEPDAWLEAAENLSRVGSGTELMWEEYWGRRGMFGVRMPRRRNPALDLDRPTAAEAILAAMRRHEIDKRDSITMSVGSIEWARDSYLTAVVGLGDPRILPELHRRTRSSAGPGRRVFARACRLLGSSGPLMEFSKDFERGRIKLPAGKAGEEELTRILWALEDAGLRENGGAFDAVARPSHPAHAAARAVLLSRRWRDWLLLGHPFVVRILGRELENREPTGVAYSGREGQLFRDVKGGSMEMEWPASLSDPAARRDCAKEFVLDLAAERLSGVIAGLPAYHPMHVESDKRLGTIRSFMALHAGRLRKARIEETALLGFTGIHDGFLPDIRPLGRPATGKDVEAGRAVFHFDGKGKPAKIPDHPAIEVKGEKGLIVQAETDGAGKVHYGVIFRHSIRRVDARDSKPVTQPKE